MVELYAVPEPIINPLVSRIVKQSGRACASFDSESLDFSSDFLSLVHRFLFFLACKYGIIP